ncbi:MAG: class I SAM-dependent methyltransferase [Acholeplasmatales bacterium]|jgi:tRNA (adenine22-N1)-methyltransferase|nr:class I SAM-dependent methyltransferase [Acholeplasmatales bacterium]
MSEPSLRIKTLAKMVQGYKIVLDCGADHGYTLLYALENNYIDEGIASDIREIPLSVAKNNLEGYNCSFYLCDGIKSINRDYDAVIISGMGVDNIIKILREADKDSIFILQPNTKYDILREFLTNNNFIIIDEEVISDGHFYCIIKVKRGFMELNQEDIYLGPILKEKKEALSYYQFMLEIEKKIYRNNAKEHRNSYKINALINIIGYLEIKK